MSTTVNGSPPAFVLFFTIRASTPCCKRPVRIRAVADAPLERYTRKCSACGLVWDVERVTMRDRRATGGVRMDSLTWVMR